MKIGQPEFLNEQLNVEIINKPEKPKIPEELKIATEKIDNLCARCDRAI